LSTSQLTIFISRTSAHVAEVLRSSKDVVIEKDYTLTEGNDVGYTEKLNRIFEDFPLKDEYQEYSLAWGTQTKTLVPLGLFNESSAKDISQFMFGKEIDTTTIDYNRLMELSMVNVFEIPNWVKRFFIIKFPRILIQHEHTMFLRALFQGSTFNRKVLVNVCNDYINIDIVFHNELIFSNSFQIQNVDDIIYYLAFTIEKEGLKEEVAEIQFYFADDLSKQLSEDSQMKIEKLKLFKNMTFKNAESSFKLQTLCV